MHIVDVESFESQEVQSEGAKNTRIQWLIDESCGAPNFAMRRFVIGPQGHTPHHCHDWEHEVYILRVRGVLVTDEGKFSSAANQAILVPPGETHQFVNQGEEALEMLCIVPNGPATRH